MDSKSKPVDYDVDKAKQLLLSDQQAQSSHQRTTQTLVGHPFSVSADVFLEPPAKCDPKLGTLIELRHVRASGKKAQVKRFIRQNNWTAGHRIRSDLWKELINQSSDIEAQRTIYHDTAQKLKKNLDSNQSLSPRFIHVSNVQTEHDLKPNGKAALLRLLSVIEHLRPDFTYVPMMEVLYPLTSLFLHYMDEEESFACVMSLLSHSQKFLMQTDIAAAAARRTLLVLVQKHAPKAYAIFKHVKQFNGDAEVLVPIVEDWKAWIFRDLPFSHLVRVVDCFLYEGQKVLFRVALAIIKLWCKEKGKELRTRSDTSLQSLAESISEFAKNIPMSPGKLLKAAFSVRNLKWSHIRTLQEKYECTLRQTDTNSIVKSESRGSLKLRKLTAASTPYVEHRLDSQIISVQQNNLLLSWIPKRFHIAKPELLFRSADHGTSFTTFWRNVEQFAPTILVIQTTKGEIFGAFCSTEWALRRQNHGKLSYFGTGESFLFRLGKVGASGEGATKYEWVGLTNPELTGHNYELFMGAEAAMLVVGGGGSDGICICENLERGVTNKCDTFNNEPLCEDRYFEIQNLEAFGFPNES